MDDARRVFEVNLVGTMALCRTCLPLDTVEIDALPRQSDDIH